jgi:hypothetical protein
MAIHDPNGKIPDSAVVGGLILLAAVITLGFLKYMKG